MPHRYIVGLWKKMGPGIRAMLLWMDVWVPPPLVAVVFFLPLKMSEMQFGIKQSQILG